MEAIINNFTEGLRGLIDEAMIFTRKSWANILSVSEPAISQWIKGRSVPAPENLRTLISACRNEKLSGFQQRKLNQFVARLEERMDDTFGKKDSDCKISDYLLESRIKELEGSLNSLFYDLKSELLNQYVREIQIIRNNLEKKFASVNEDDNFDKKIEGIKKLSTCFKSENYRQAFDQYTMVLTNFHLDYNAQLSKYLDSIEIIKEGNEYKTEVLETRASSESDFTSFADGRCSSGIFFNKTLNSNRKLHLNTSNVPSYEFENPKMHIKCTKISGSIVKNNRKTEEWETAFENFQEFIMKNKGNYEANTDFLAFRESNINGLNTIKDRFGLARYWIISLSPLKDIESIPLGFGHIECYSNDQRIGDQNSYLIAFGPPMGGTGLILTCEANNTSHYFNKTKICVKCGSRLESNLNNISANKPQIKNKEG